MNSKIAKLFPYETWTLKTPLEIPQLVDGLAQRIEPRKWVRWSSPEYDDIFEGKVSEHGFTISRAINYRNSFLPVLKGTFISTYTGTLIKIRMTLDFIVWGLLMGTGGMLSLFTFAGIIEFIDEGSWTLLMFGAGGIVFIVSLVNLCFRIEARKAKSLISELLLELYEEKAKQI